METAEEFVDSLICNFNYIASLFASTRSFKAYMNMLMLFFFAIAICVLAIYLHECMCL